MPSHIRPNISQHNKGIEAYEQRAVIAIDIQNEYFPEGRAPLVGIEQAADNASQAIEAARVKDNAVIRVCHVSTSTTR